MKITASRLSEGNKFFPAEINIEPNGLTVKISGFFSGESQHLDYKNIGDVSVDEPLVGYSTIAFYTAGTMVTAHGFTSAEVKQIKKAIEKGKQSLSKNLSDSIAKKQKTGEQIIAKAKAEKIKYELEKRKKHDNSLKPWLNNDNFKNKSCIDAILFPNDVEDIEKTIEKIIKAGVEKIKEVEGEFKTTEIKYTSLGDRNFLKPYYQEFELVETCLEKANEGIKKLKRKDLDNKELNNIIIDMEEISLELKEKWLPKLQEKIEKKKRKNIITIIVIIAVNILFWSGLNILK